MGKHNVTQSEIPWNHYHCNYLLLYYYNHCCYSYHYNCCCKRSHK